MQWYLESVVDGGKEWQVSIAAVPFVIGRADDCNLKLTDYRVSRYHSEIRISGDLIWVRDLDSTNGTFINQKKIEQAQLLDPNDTISIGSYNFRVKSVSSAEAVEADETMHATLSAELKFFDLSTFEPKFRHLLSTRNVIPHFQPLLRFSDMSIVGYEILGRIQDADLPSNPSELLDIAECLGCSSQLSSLFREVGVEKGKTLPGSQLLFVNSTKFEIYETEALLASMQKIRDLAGSNKIVLEINEKAAAGTDNLPALRDTLAEMNMGLAFDDFGVGQTRLVELSNSPPDYLKFDHSLIRKIHVAPWRLQQMISTFIKASHDLGIQTVAEGIECAEESEVCQQLGFDLAQGFFLGKPVPIQSVDHQAACSAQL